MRKALLIGTVCVTLSSCATEGTQTLAFNEPRAFTPDLAPLPKWEAVLNRMDQSPGIFPPVKNRSPHKTIIAVNEAVNGYTFVGDSKRDYWQSPDEFFRSGGGDCEDFAIAKYAWLRELGMPEDNMQIAVVNDRFVNQAHALLLVNMDGAPFVLDNKSNDEKTFAARYDPIFGFNRNGVWIY